MRRIEACKHLEQWVTYPRIACSVGLKERAAVERIMRTAVGVTMLPAVEKLLDVMTLV